MRYWWVNHKQTQKFEIAGGFLWSPIVKKNGARNRFYDNMRNASPGDVVISYSDMKISYLGIVEDFARASPIPPSFGRKGEGWSKDEGWILPVRWGKLPKAIRPKDEIAELSSLLPTVFSPLSPITGNGRQHVYLAEVGEELFIRLAGDVHLNEMQTESRSPEFGSALELVDDSIETQILSDLTLDMTTRLDLIAARRGQGVFKLRIRKFEVSCRLTHVKTAGLLVASHIKPWRVCHSSQERLDGANGLLLAPHVDWLFDRGMISFGDHGDVLISSRLDMADLKLMGLDNACASGCGMFRPEQLPYLQFHRLNVFLP
jgi:putative restriction endonuclease